MVRKEMSKTKSSLNSKIGGNAEKKEESKAHLELKGLYTSLGETLETLNVKVEPLLEYFDNDMTYEKGDEILDYLKVKKQILLSYVTNLVFYMQLKLEGKSCASHPVMDALIELRYAMERMRPMDGKLKYQIDRLIKSADVGQQDKGSFSRPNPMALLSKEDGGVIVDQINTEEKYKNSKGSRGSGDVDGEDEEDDDDDDDDDDDENNSDKDGEADGIYRPPRIEAAYYMDAESKTEKEEAALKRKRKKLKNSEIYDALREEFTTAPEMSTSTGVSSLSGLEKKLREDAKERTDFEEERFVRMTVSRKEKQAIKRKERELSQTNILGGFGNVDDLDDLVENFREVSENATKQKRAIGNPGLGMNGRGKFAFDDDDDDDGDAGYNGNEAKAKGNNKKRNRMTSTTTAAGSEDAIKRAAMAFSRSKTITSSANSSKSKKKMKK